MRNKIALTILRVCLGVVFLMFGIGKFQNDYWARTIETMPFFQHFPWDVKISVYLIGTSEVLIGAFLITGLFSRFFSALASAQLIVILFLLNFQETRDIGLLGAAIYLASTSEKSYGIGSTHEPEDRGLSVHG